jgi:Zn-dependent protease with chaperone function
VPSRSCLVGIVLSYLPRLVLLGAIGACFAWAGAAGTVLWVLIAALLGYAWIFGVYRSTEIRHRGVKVTREDQPELMAVVEDVMQRAGIRRLAGVWLAPDPGARALIGRRDLLWRRHDGVALGLLTVAHLSADELSAILAHEAGHLTDRHTLRLILSQRRWTVGRNLRSRTTRPLRWYWTWFLKVTREQCLDNERHADAVATQLCGADLAERAHHREAEAQIVHDIVMRRFIRPLWNRQIAPATFFEAYEAVWDRTPGRVAAAVTAWMQTPDQPQDTHPGLAERCGGRSFPLRPSLRGDLPLARLEQLDRRCAASLRQQELRRPMTVMTWPEISANRERLGTVRWPPPGEEDVTPAPG